MAHYIVDLYPSFDRKTKSGSQDEDMLHQGAIERVTLLRKLFSDRERYGCQGYGHKVWFGDMPVDNTYKRDVQKTSLLPIWLTSINSTFRGLGERRFRDKTWQAYALAIVDIRKTALALLGELQKGITIYFRKSTIYRLVDGLVNTPQWEECKAKFLKPPLLPSSAIDEWGFVDESTSTSSKKELGERSIDRTSLILHRYVPFLKAFRKYTQSFSNFLGQAVQALIVNPEVGRTAQNETDRRRIKENAAQLGISVDAIRLSSINLTDAVKALSSFQKEFRNLLGHFFSAKDLDNLERQERIIIGSFHSLWYFFAFHSERVMQKALNECTTQAANIMKSARSNLRQEFRVPSLRNLQVKILSEDMLWDSQRGLCIGIDGTSAVEVYNSVESVMVGVRHAIVRIKDTELRRQIIDINWPYLFVLPLLHGKSLTATAWRIHMPTLIASEDGNLSWWNQVWHPVPLDALSSIGISLWNFPLLEIGTRLVEKTNELPQLVAHIDHLTTLPDLSKEERLRLQDYFNSITPSVIGAHSTAKEAAEEMSSIVDNLLEDDGETNYLVIAKQALTIVEESFPPEIQLDEEARLDIENLIGKHKDLEQARIYSFIAHLYLASYLVEAKFS